MPERKRPASREPRSPRARKPRRADGTHRLTGVAGYSTREVSDVLGLPTSTILAWTRAGLLSPQRDRRGAYVFSFQDIAVLRSARELLEADVPSRRVRQTLEALRERLPPGRPLSAVQLSALGGRVLVREEGRAWEPDTGQLEIPLTGTPADSPPPAERGVPLSPPPAPAGGADDLFDAALELEGTAPDAAADLYRRALEADPAHAEAHLNLGRLLHEEGALDEAESHYRAARRADPAYARASYNLGVALEDQGRAPEAMEAYRAALAADAELAVAHFNLSRLYEAAGASTEALRHLASYKRILDRAGG